MTSMNFIGLDIHKKTISFCAKAQDGTILDQGTIVARRDTLVVWAKARPRPWIGAMEATLFTGWIYDLLKPLAKELKVAHPAMLKAIAASKKKNDKVDARTIADLLRCNLLPECYMAPCAIRDLRRVLRYRNLVVRQATRMKNRIAGLLMETGTSYNKERLHGKAYFSELLGSLRDVPRSVVELLRLSRGQLEFFAAIQRWIFASRIFIGSAPVSSTWAWNSRMSNFGPSCCSASRRSRWIVSAPILYAVAWLGIAM